MKTKYLLKQAARGLVPERIIHKKKVGFFHGAVGHWLTMQKGGAVEKYLLPADAHYAELLDRRAVGQLIDGHGGARRDGNSRLLLSILLLEVWLSTFIPRAVPTASLELSSLR